MPTMPTLNVQPRTALGSTETIRLRQKGFIPAVIYGKDFAASSLSIKYDDFLVVLKTGERLITLNSDKFKEKVIIKDVNYDEVIDRITHVDFHRISLTEQIEVKVPLKFKHHAVGALQDGVVEEHFTELTIKCLPESIPHFIEVDISHMKIGDILHAKDIKLPEGATLHVKPENIVITVHEKVEEIITPAAGAEPGPVEPEVITAKKEKPEDEEAGASGADEKKKAKEAKSEAK